MKGEECGLVRSGVSLSRTDADQRHITLRYDALGRMVETKDGLGRSSYFAFDELGNLVERVDGAGERLRMEHDASGRVVRRTGAGGAGTSPIDDTYRFDGFGRMVLARNAHTTLTFGYDALDRALSVTDEVSGTAQLRYDADGRTVQAIYPNRPTYGYPEGVSVHYLYNARSQLQAVVDPVAGIFQLEYDAAGRAVRRIDPSGVQRTRRAIALVSRCTLVCAVVGVVLALAGASQAATLNQARSAAISWLEGHQNSDGSWGSGDRRPLVTAEALLALAKAGRSAGSPALRAKSWLLNQQPASLDFRARIVRALKASGVDVSREASDLDAMGYVAIPANCDASSTGGWGPTSERAVTSYDTALVIAAIKAAGLTPNCQGTKLGKILYVLQRGDEGWSGDGVPFDAQVPAEASDRTVTAEIVRALAVFFTGPEGDKAANFIATSPTPPGGPVTAQTDALEVASRLAALHAVSRVDALLEGELLNDARLTAAGVWSDTDAYLNAIGLLAVTSKPGFIPTTSCLNTADYDCDSYLDAVDTFPHNPSEHADTDGDGIGDGADTDRDGDGYCDPNETGGCSGTDLAAFANDPTEHADTDGDGVGDNDEMDADADGWSVSEEIEAGTDPALVDTDGDGTSDSQDPCPLGASVFDTDGDGVCPPLDECNTHLDPLDLRNLDGDVECDQADDDDDQDTFADWLELAAGSDPRDGGSIPASLAPTGDFDRDGITNAQEVATSPETSPYLADTDADGATDSYEIGIVPSTIPTNHSSQPRALIAVFSSASTAPPAIAGQPYEPGLVSTNGLLRATVTGGQSTPVALPGAPQAPSAASGFALLAGFQPQTMLGRDLDGDGLSGVQEALLRTSGTNVDTDGDLFVDGAGGVVGISRLPGGWDLEPDSTVDGEADFGTDPADAADRPGMAGDVAPLGHPNGQLDVADVLVEYRIIRDPAIVAPLAPQNEAIALEAADGNGDETIDAGDLQRLLHTIQSEQP